MSYFKHPQAIVEHDNIGAGTRIWAFAHLLPGSQIGADCNICDHVFIEKGTKIGSRVTIKCGVQLWDGITIEDDVFVGPNATFTNDPFPRSKQHPRKYAQTLICQGASIGANATILPGIMIGRNAMVGAGAVVTSHVPANAIVTGNPARITGYVGLAKGKLTTQNASARLGATRDPNLKVRRVRLIRLPFITDIRGSLVVAEHAKQLPFIPKRIFLVFNVPSKDVRGEHAHKKLHQLLICVKGSCMAVVDDGRNREEILLDTPQVAVYVPPMIWSVQYKYTDDAVLLVAASDLYDPKDYIRDYEEYLKRIKRKRSADE
jgi:acetyltransferase-like isoleucine patch superfamily enzyme/dTDP-4-dehydrorhamnose 3,5-epimerase-like enzyme